MTVTDSDWSTVLLAGFCVVMFMKTVLDVGSVNGGIPRYTWLWLVAAALVADDQWQVFGLIPRYGVRDLISPYVAPVGNVAVTVVGTVLTWAHVPQAALGPAVTVGLTVAFILALSPPSSSWPWPWPIHRRRRRTDIPPEPPNA